MPSSKKKYNRIAPLGKHGLQKLADGVLSVAQLGRELGYTQSCGGAYSTIKKYLTVFDIDTSHWTGRAWSKNRRLKDWSQYSKHQNFRKHLIKVKKNTCNCCQRTLWEGKRIPLEVHHVDGDRTNNAFNNLQLLCPNCHALTSTWRGRNNRNYS